ncbi:MAG: isopentenyl phosphate kinase [Thermoplasmata archaeon]|nr:isopentenyl phosphate kinase [Thermoplasmata archaeon]
MKLGGSVVTDKAAYRAPRLDVLSRLAQESATTREPLIVVHGAGSYGHVLAKQFDLARGRDEDARRDAAFAQVHADVRELSVLVLEALRDAGLPALAHSTYDLARLHEGKLLSFAHVAVADTLAAGFIPVLSGDGVLDASRGWGILSGDVIMAELARAFRPQRAVFVTDVDGIFDRWPEGRLLPRIGPHDHVGAAGAKNDVTGGMVGKLARAREVAKAGVEVVVVNGLVPGRLADALAGKATLGTIVTA